MGIEEVLIAPRSPWQNAFAERVIGTSARVPGPGHRPQRAASVQDPRRLPRALPPVALPPFSNPRGGARSVRSSPWLSVGSPALLKEHSLSDPKRGLNFLLAEARVRARHAAQPRSTASPRVRPRRDAGTLQRGGGGRARDQRGGVLQAPVTRSGRHGGVPQEELRPRRPGERVSLREAPAALP